MNRRKFLAAAVGAAAIPQLPKVFPVIQENYSIFDLDVTGAPQFAYLESTAKGMADFNLEWQEYMTRVIATAFDLSPYMLGE